MVSGAAIGTAPLKTVAGTDSSKKQQWYELRTYLFGNDTQRQLTDSYLQQAFLPALNRAGISYIGVFSELQPQATAGLFLLVPYPSPEALPEITEKLARDAVYATTAAP